MFYAIRLNHSVIMFFFESLNLAGPGTRIAILRNCHDRHLGKDVILNNAQFSKVFFSKNKILAHFWGLYSDKKSCFVIGNVPGDLNK